MARQAAALAQTELELAQCNSEEELEEDIEVHHSKHIEHWVEETNAFLEAPNEHAKRSEIAQLAEAIIGATRISQPAARISELPTFTGNHEEWLPFKRAYRDSATCFNHTQNMARLRQAIQGQAKEAVRSLLFVASDPEEVVTALERRFGRPEQLIIAELEKIKDLPKLGDSPRDICVFANRINNAVTTIGALNKTQYLYSPEASKYIIEKLSPILRYRWLDFNSRQGPEPELIKIKNFLDNEADLCSAYAPPEAQRRPRHGRHPVHAALAEQKDAPAPEQYRRVCPHCKEDHWLTECRKFKEASVDERWTTAKKQALCFRCLRRRHSRDSCKGPPCKKCKRSHHTMLHAEKPAPSGEAAACNQVQEEQPAALNSVYTATDSRRIFLKMIPVYVYGPTGNARVLALLDEGSTVSLIDRSVAERIGATGSSETLVLETVGGKILQVKNSQQITLRIKGAHRSDKRELKGVRTVDNLKLSPQSVNEKDIEKYEHLRKLKAELAYENERPSLLIGQDNWGLIVTRRIIKGRRNEPAASLTSLGWVLHGDSETNATTVNFVNHCRASRTEDIEQMIKNHFDIESIGVQPRRPSNDADGRALAVLERTTRRMADGRIESGLLWKSDEETLPYNRDQALVRLKSIERKLNRNVEHKKEYAAQLDHLVECGYAEEAPSTTTPGRTFYLPHFAVTHPTKKKMRIVFDAAARFGGKSLNDALLSGPDLLQSLFGVLLRFRQGPVAVVADIKEMFLQIRIRQEDRDSLRYLWRGGDANNEIKAYRMTSVIFGAASSPATAIFAKNANAKHYEKEHPEAARAIIRNHYMDDYLQSFESTKEASRISSTVDEIHRKAGFELRQWASNKEEIFSQTIASQEKRKEVSIGEEEKTLGLRWRVKEDVLTFNVGLRNTPPDVISGERAPTKREVTSAVMSTFDPMGLVAPVLIGGKRLIQHIWRTGANWDEAIDETSTEMWAEYLEDLKSLEGLTIPRWLATGGNTGELHTFTDASETAYAAISYWRSQSSDGEVHVSLIAAKVRVTPLKPVSIPRLELQAALLGARLAATIASETDLNINRKVYWSDSTTVLQWMKSDPRRFKAFVAHRLAEIEESTNPREWRWVPTKENPADDATRKLIKPFTNASRWYRGPNFLYAPENEWPVKKIYDNKPSEEEIKKKETVAAVRTTTEEVLPDPEKFSSWTRLLRTTARVFMFIDLCRTKGNVVNAARNKDEWKPYKKAPKRKYVHAPQMDEAKRWLPIPEECIRKAKRALVKRSQTDAFEEDIRRMEKGLRPGKDSRLSRIDVHINECGILCINNRAKKIAWTNKNIAVLDGKNRTVRLLIEHYHRHFCHGNQATVINELRQTFWILSLRTAVKKIIHDCQWCRLRKAKPRTPPLGDLPAERLTYGTFPFTCTGVDYFGPMYVTVGRRKEKRWGALFTCLTTRAIHLELAPSLSTSSMIMALRRMAARRGAPKVLYSDNATNFVGADNELREEAAKMKQSEIVEAAEREGIKWKFIPPGAPNMGGAWERMVRSVKVALSAVLNERQPPEEVLHTLLTEVEHIVNSRPLTHLESDPNDEESLTPNHFLIGRSCGSTIIGDFDDIHLVGKADWKSAQRLADHFWKRWLKEYLPALRARPLCGRKLPDPEKGDIVIIADASLPRTTWPRGEVIAAYNGPDGRTRIVDVRTTGGILRRPTSRLVVIVPAASRPIEEVHAGACTAGETVGDAKQIS